MFDTEIILSYGVFQKFEIAGFKEVYLDLCTEQTLPVYQADDNSFCITLYQKTYCSKIQIGYFEFSILDWFLWYQLMLKCVTTLFYNPFSDSCHCATQKGTLSHDGDFGLSLGIDPQLQT